VAAGYEAGRADALAEVIRGTGAYPVSRPFPEPRPYVSYGRSQDNYFYPPLRTFQERRSIDPDFRGRVEEEVIIDRRVSEPRAVYPSPCTTFPDDYPRRRREADEYIDRRPSEPRVVFTSPFATSPDDYDYPRRRRDPDERFDRASSEPRIVYTNPFPTLTDDYEYIKKEQDADEYINQVRRRREVEEYIGHRPSEPRIVYTSPNAFVAVRPPRYRRHDDVRGWWKTFA